MVLEVLFGQRASLRKKKDVSPIDPILHVLKTFSNELSWGSFANSWVPVLIGCLILGWLGVGYVYCMYGRPRSYLSHIFINNII